MDDIEKIKEENKYLKDLLKQNNIVYTLPKHYESKILSIEEKISIYVSYFNGRNDIFAHQYTDKEQKKHCFPHCIYKTSSFPYCELGLTCKECNNKKYRGIKKDDIFSHLKGEKFYGIYPLLSDNKTNFLVFDFDDNDYKNSSISFSSLLHEKNIDHLIEISQSGQGVHIWVFFSTPIFAYKARRLGTFLLTDALTKYTTIRLNSFDRMIPSQDYLPTNGSYGNLIMLPLNGKLAIENKTVFVDNNFVPYPIKEQLHVLNSTKKISEYYIDSLIKQYEESNLMNISDNNFIYKIKLSKSDFPNSINIIKDNHIVIAKAGLTNKLIKALYCLSSISNPEYFKQIRRRQPIYAYGKILYPRYLTLYREDEKYLYLPRGIESSLLNLFKFYHIEYKIENHQNRGHRINVDFNGELRMEQQLAVDELLNYNYGLFVAPPSYGKTIVAINVITKLKINALIIAPNIALLKQWKEKLKSFIMVKYKYNKEAFGTFSGNKKKLTNQIDVASLQSLESEEGKKILNNYGIIIFDEAHHLAASTYSEILRACKSKYLFGLTATPQRSDDNQKIIYKLLGEIRVEEKNNENSSILIKILKPIFTNFSFKKTDKTISYADQISILLKNEDRNKEIIKTIIDQIENKKNILLLSDRIEHLELLMKLLENKINAFFVKSGLHAKEKKEFYDNLSNAKNGFIVLATGKYIGEGFDESKFDTLILSSPFKWKGTLKQYLGRLDRNHTGKQQINVYDFVDIKVPIFRNMYYQRLRGYKSNKYTLKENYNEEKTLFNNKDYYSKLIFDLKNANKNVKFYMNKFDLIVLKKLKSNITAKLSIVLDNKIKSSYPDDNIIYQNDVPNMIIIDNHILWYGGLNPFVQNNYNDVIMRLDDQIVSSL